MMKWFMRLALVKKVYDWWKDRQQKKGAEKQRRQGF